VLDLEPADAVAEGTPRESAVMVQTQPAKSALAAVRPVERAWLAVLAVSVFAALAAVSLLARRGDAPDGGRGAAAASAPAPIPGSIDVVLRYSPASAAATLDGARIDGSPFHGRFPRDGSVHQLEVRADDFRAERRVLAFDRDHEILIDLAREEGAGPGPGAAAPGPTGPAADPAGKAGVPPPGAPKPPAAKPQHEIDEQNPYAQ
jgi:hypothetical protein